MKTLIALLLLSVSAVGATVKFSWEYDTAEAAQIGGFRFYESRGTNSPVVLESIPADVRVFQHAFAPGEHAVFLTAVSPDGLESEPSNTVTFWVPRAPSNIAIVITGTP